MSKELIERLRSNFPTTQAQWEAADRIEELERELECERMRLVACGVVAMADTPDSAKKVRQMHPDYESASCESVARRVDECISLREKCDALQADNTRLREALTKERYLRVLGQSPECGKIHWESIRDMRRDMFLDRQAEHSSK